jgi:hypothetical protein
MRGDTIAFAATLAMGRVACGERTASTNAPAVRSEAFIPFVGGASSPFATHTFSMEEQLCVAIAELRSRGQGARATR